MACRFWTFTCVWRTRRRHESFACALLDSLGPTLSSSTFHSLTDVRACKIARSSFSSTSQNFESSATT